MARKILLSFCILCALFTVNVFAASSAFKLENPYNEKDYSYVLVGHTYKLISANGGNVENCSSADSSIITVTKDGTLTVLKTGDVVLTATSDGRKATVTFHAIKRSESIRLNYYKLYISRNYKNYPSFKATLYPSDCTDGIRFKTETSDGETALVYAGKTTGQIYTETGTGNSSSVVTAQAVFHPEAIYADYDADVKTDTAYLKLHTHNWKYKCVAADSVYHSKVCTVENCTVTDPSEMPDYEMHNFYKGTKVCIDCNFEDKSGHEHIWAEQYTADSDSHWHGCTVSGCNAKKDLQPHSFDFDNKCKSCKAEHIHNNYTDKISADDFGHWNSCLECDSKYNYTPHSTEAQGTCTVAATCDICAMPYKFGTHPDDGITHNDTEYSHSASCKYCKESIMNGSHEYVKESDTTSKCTVCDFVHTHTWSDWTASRDGHSRKCSKNCLNILGAVYKIESEFETHTYGADDICTACGYNKNIPEIKDNAYQISTLGELKYFASLVNGGETSANAVLTADITSDGSLDCIGTSEKPYGGTFDGNGHSIEIKIDNAQSKSGLFGTASGAVIKNLTVSGGINITDNNVKHVGGVVGNAKGGTIITNVTSNVSINGVGVFNHIGGIVGSSQELSGTLLIENCLFGGSVNLPNTKDCVGGILGYANDNVNIKNCGAFGSVVGTDSGHIGGILGYVNSANFGSIENCWFSSAIDGGAIIGTVKQENLNIKNNFCTSGAKAFGGSAASSYTANFVSDWHSGEATWALNGGLFDGTQVWYQDLSQDNTYPTFSGKTVYRTGKTSYANSMPSAAVFVQNDNVEVLYVNQECVLVFAAYNGSWLAASKVMNISAPTVVKKSDIFSNDTPCDRVKIMILKDLIEIEPLCEFAE